MVEALRLSPEQRERIQAIEEDIFASQMRQMRSAETAESSSKAREPEGVSVMERIRAVLTVKQLQGLREMAGEPIRGPLSAFPMPFGSCARRQAAASLNARQGDSGKIVHDPVAINARRPRRRERGSHLSKIGNVGTRLNRCLYSWLFRAGARKRRRNLDG